MANDEFEIARHILKEGDELASAVDPSAPIEMPARSDLVVKLVSLDKLRLLDDARSDVQTFFGLMLLFAGGVVGFLVNMMTSNQSFDRFAWSFLGALFLVVLVFARLLRRSTRRADDVRKEIFAKGDEL